MKYNRNYKDEILNQVQEENGRGFTLIELLVVVLIIGILAAVALPQYQLAVTKSRIVRLLPLIRAINTAQKVHLLATGNYAATFSNLDIEMPAGASTSTDIRVDYENFSCYFNGNRNGLYCKDARNSYPLLEKYFGEERIHCWYGAEQLAERICQSFPGSYKNTGATNLYNFPF